jgi:CRISPR-associated protein Cas1
LIDLTVLQAFESRVLDLGTFHKFDDYRSRFNPEAKERFNRGVCYRGQRLKWDTVIEEKTSELARFLTEKTSTVDFAEPSPKLDRLDDRELRERINSLTLHEAKKRGLGKSTLHYLRRNARRGKPLKVYGKVKEKLSVLTK